MAIRIYAKHPPYSDGRLGGIVDEMRHCGAPTIWAVRWRGNLFALTGSHRLAARDILGLDPKIVVLPADGSNELDGFFERAIKSLPVYEFNSHWRLEMGE